MVVLFNFLNIFIDLSRAQRTLSETLNNFNFECIGTSQTDDEMVIGKWRFVVSSISHFHVNFVSQFVQRLCPSPHDDRR